MTAHNISIAKADAAINSAIAALVALRDQSLDLANGIVATEARIADSVSLGDPEAVREALQEGYRYSRGLISLQDTLEQVHRLVTPLAEAAYQRWEIAQCEAYAAVPEADWI